MEFDNLSGSSEENPLLGPDLWLGGGLSRVLVFSPGMEGYPQRVGFRPGRVAHRRRPRTTLLGVPQGSWSRECRSLRRSGDCLPLTLPEPSSLGTPRSALARWHQHRRLFRQSLGSARQYSALTRSPGAVVARAEAPG